MEEGFIVISFVVSEKKRGGEKRPPKPKYRKNTPCEIGLKCFLNIFDSCLEYKGVSFTMVYNPVLRKYVVI